METQNAMKLKKQLEIDIVSLIIEFEKQTKTIIADIAYYREECIGKIDYDALRFEVAAVLTDRTYESV